MTDIFLSYSREDAAETERLANALRAAGYHCWWDRELVSGARYLIETEAQLKASKVVLVIWSRDSIRSHWVADEAAVGRDENRLAAVSFDGSMPPLGFRQFQVTDFTGWQGGAGEVAFHNLLRGLERLLPRLTDAAPAIPVADTPREPPRHSPTADLSLIVKPFEVIGGTSDVQDVAEGLTEEVIGDLAKISALRVISRSAVARFRGSTAAACEIAAEAKVRYVVTGTVRRGGDRLRVSCELADALHDRVDWSDRFDGSVDDPFHLQEAVARGIAAALHVRLTADDEGRLAARPITDPRAAECARRAMAALSMMSASGLEQARELLHRGLEIVGPNAQLLGLEAAVAFQYINLGIDTDPVQVAARMARIDTLVTAALRLDPRQPDALFVRAWQVGSQGKITESMRDSLRVLEADPNHLGALGLFGFICMWSGLSIELRQTLARLESIDPWNPWGSYLRARLATAEGTAAERDVAIGQMLALFGGGLGACVAVILWGISGEWQRARPALESAVSAGGSDLGSVLAGAFLGAISGKPADTRTRLERLRVMSTIENDLDWQHMIAVAYALADERDAALEHLAKAVHLGFVDPLLLSSANRSLAPLLEGSPGLALLRDAETHRQRMRTAMDDLQRELQRKLR